MLAGAAGGCWPVVSGKTPGRSRAQYPASRPNTRSWAQDPVPRPKTRSASRHVPGETSFQRLLLLDIPQDSAGPQSRGIGGEESWIPGTFLFQAHFMKMAHQPSVRKSHMFPQITRITRIPKWSLDFPNVPLDSPNDLPREGTKQIVLFWGNFPPKKTITPSSFPPSGNLLLQDVPGNVFLKALLAPKCCPTDIARSCMRLLSGMRTHVGLQCCCTQYSLVTHKTL